MIRRLHPAHSDNPTKPTTPLTPYMAIPIPLTIRMLCFMFRDYTCIFLIIVDTQCYFILVSGTVETWPFLPFTIWDLGQITLSL